MKLLLGFILGLGLSVMAQVDNVGVSRNLDFEKQDKIIFSTRAPTAKDEGRLWITYTANSDTNMTFYVRHPVSGTWRNEVFN